MSEQEQPDPNEPEPHRWQLLRDVVSFQFKLAIDGLRDVLLSPISIGAALIGVFTDSKKPGKYFYRLLKAGHKTDHWINLFGTYSDDSPVDGVPSPDTFVKKAESLIVKEYHKGGIVQNLKHTTDSVMDRIQKPRGQDSD